MVLLEISKSSNDERFDSLIIIAKCLNDLDKYNLKELTSILETEKKGNTSFDNDLTFCLSNGKRIIYSPTGPINNEYDDVRVVSDATTLAFKKAIKIGSKSPLLINCTKEYFELSDSVALLSALQVSYIPLEIREISSKTSKINKLGFLSLGDEANTQKLLETIDAIEVGRNVVRDISGSDPERMCSLRIYEYVKEVFENSNIKISAVEDANEFEKFYPCFAAVNRASKDQSRHNGKIIKLDYNPPESSVIDKTIFLVGKGITYDTGGADIKYGGSMIGMHRDKCGSAFVAGFFKVLSILKPKGLKVYGTMCVARNNVGEESYVSDEIITSRANVRIRIGNTDAEGRMVMTDPLCEAKELALKSINPQLFTIATLTGHVIRAYGPNYAAILPNGVARKQEIHKKLYDSGNLIGDPYEISSIRREDYEFHKGKNEYEDVVQANNKPSTETPRGHQAPAAYLIMASGLDKHGIDSSHPLPYSHLDIAGSSGPFPGFPTGSPLLSFVQTYVIPRI